MFTRPQSLVDFLDNASNEAKRDVLRALRGSILRTELYALDNDKKQETRPSLYCN